MSVLLREEHRFMQLLERKLFKNLIENLYYSPKIGPQFGPTLYNFRLVLVLGDYCSQRCRPCRSVITSLGGTGAGAARLDLDVGHLPLRHRQLLRRGRLGGSLLSGRLGGAERRRFRQRGR